MYIKPSSLNLFSFKEINRYVKYYPGKISSRFFYKFELIFLELIWKVLLKNFKKILKNVSLLLVVGDDCNDTVTKITCSQKS